MALRKKSALRTMREPVKDEELLMFGYQCNVFRDDEKALFIDQGKHLIPWNGDDTIMIDRYDVRAYLSDLTEYDADVMRRRHEPLTEKERHLEALLDEERYLELRTDVTEKMMYEEEEMKRLNEALAGNSYGAVGFNYVDPSNSIEAVDGDDDQASSAYDQPYTVIPGLPLPPDMTVPATMKVHAIIEKTASFVSKQGVQMEIILKTKQKNNQQFEFLNYDNELNSYYRHLVKVIKQGKYQPAPPLVQQESEEHDDSHSYLHPSLTSAEMKEPEPSPITSQEFLESIQSKLPAGQIANTSYAILLSNLKKHANVVVQKSAASHQAAGQSADSAKVVAAAPLPPPPPMASQSQSLLSSADASPVNCHEESPEGEQKRKHKKRSRDASDQSPCKPESKRRKDLVHGPLIIPPPPDQQPIIDKMADYVARNGPEFEMVVRMKNDERFRFLDSGHVHHNYYQYKKQIFLKEMEAQKVEEANKDEEQQLESGCEVEPKTSKSNDEEEAVVSTEATEKEEADDKAANVSKAVSFSIKTKEEEVTSLKTRTALLYESSGDEDEDDSEESEVASLASRSLPHNLSRSSLASTTAEKPTGNSEELGKKQAEQKLADRLAAAAREKLARESKERQLQAQRKRKAAMFISMLKDIDSIDANAGPTGTSGTGASAPAEDAATDGFGGSIDSPFASSLGSRSVTPTMYLEQVTSTLTATVMSVQPVVSAPAARLTPSTVTPPSRSSHHRRPRSRSRDRSRHSKRHRKHSNTPPTAYTMGRRPSSKSPTSSRHPSHSQSKHKLKHSLARSTSRPHSESKSRRKDTIVIVDHKRKSRSRSSDRKSKKESSGSKKSSNKSHKKKSSKDPGVSRRHKSKKHKSKSKHRRSVSASPEDDDQQPSKRSKLAVDRNNPDVVDLTGSPRAEDIGSRFAY